MCHSHFGLWPEGQQSLLLYITGSSCIFFFKLLANTDVGSVYGVCRSVCFVRERIAASAEPSVCWYVGLGNLNGWLYLYAVAAVTIRTVTKWLWRLVMLLLWRQRKLQRSWRREYKKPAGLKAGASVLQALAPHRVDSRLRGRAEAIKMQFLTRTVIVSLQLTLFSAVHGKRSYSKEINT